MSIIAPLNLDKFINDLNLKEIKSPAILSSKGKYDPDGLFSESIFGLERSNERRTRYAYINLNTRILHPFIYEIFKKIERKVIELIDGEKYFFNQESKTISKDYIEGYIEISGFDGAMFAIDNDLFLRGETEPREKIIKHLRETIKDGTAFIDKFLIIPPDYRPAQIADDGSLLGVDDLNSFYIKLINLSKKIRMTDQNDKYGKMSESALIRKDIQKLVNETFNYGKLKIGKKSGLNRSNLLGKRVDFSARSVVTGGPELPIGVLGVPYRILANIFQPFLIHFFTRELQSGSEHYDHFIKILNKNDFESSLNTLIITNFLSDLSDDAIKMSKEDEKFIIDLFQTILNDKYVVMKRDPALHKGSWQSFKIRVIGEVAIRVPISQTSLFNMDFDGDSSIVKVRVFFDKD
jgi:DNA-directed RNA polymerase beta' subunit